MLSDPQVRASLSRHLRNPYSEETEAKGDERQALEGPECRVPAALRAECAAM